MKKNKMMRIASILLVVTLLSTCVISGTFAKYVTKAEGQDHARVAKWGVLVTMDGASVFSDVYDAEDESYVEAGGKYSVAAYNTKFDEDGNVTEHGDKLVAPGTKLDGLKATVSGTPEVAARYELKVDGLQDVCLPAGTYTDYTELVVKTLNKDTGVVDDNDQPITEPVDAYGYFNTFTTEKDYYPVQWDLVISSPNAEYRLSEKLEEVFSAHTDLYNQAVALGLNPNGCSLMATLKILEKVAGKESYINIVEEALGSIVSGGRNFQLEITKDDEGNATGLDMSYDFDPNREMHFTFQIEWEWLFEQEDFELYDKADTLLGNLIAAKLDGTTLKTANDYMKEIDPNAEEITLTSTDAVTLEIGANFVASATQID